MNNKSSKKKKRTVQEEYELREQEQNVELLSKLENFLKEKEGEMAQIEKETEENKKSKKKLNEKIQEIELLKQQNKTEEIYDLLIKTVRE
jgi:hypothetical protein